MKQFASRKAANKQEGTLMDRMSKSRHWSEKDSEKLAKAMLQEAGRGEWTFQAIRERLEEEPYFEKLKAESEQDYPEEMEVYDEKLSDIAMDVEACLDWPEDGDELEIEDEPEIADE